MLAHTREAMPDPRGYRPSLGDDAIAVLKRMLAKNPDDRYASATDMARAYRDAISGAPVLVTPPVDLDDATVIPALNPTPKPMAAARQTGTQTPAATQAAAETPRRGISRRSRCGPIRAG